ncbi:TraR/DksA family transcriptional regulator [Streptomyces sp. NPDC001739]|uniref:TraR/DksA C4-type zinc finger protein n=1 Tax=Streptomyces siderophoricus TaxID=2802281 RepID=A0ABS1MMH5_9ACTN|nr:MULTISPECIES: TraR/DksA C4-type zinc finger protein [unclassified Streptomyces]MBL1088971.1 TraR/DksA C4-type zinc finger protein [Streptomyces sp. 9-7]
MVAKKTAAEKSTTPAGEAVAKQPAPKNSTPKKAAPKKAAARKTTATKTTAKKTAAAKTAKRAPATKAAEPAKKTGAKTVVAKKTAAATAGEHGNDSAVPVARTAAAPGELAVRPGEDPWTAAEVAEARSELMEEAGRLRLEITTAEDAIAGLMRDSGDGAGDDEADTGSKNITREHELALASNAREMLHQTERALGRLDAGTYGLCENCGNPIGKARMQAFPRATLCVECKQKQERR